jgi:hypothetical protein
VANQFVMQQVRRERERQSPVKAAAGNPVQAQTRTVRPVENTTASAAQSIREELAAARRANPPSRTYLPWEVSSTSAGEDHTEKYTGTLKTLTERLEAGERELIRRRHGHAQGHGKVFYGPAYAGGADLPAERPGRAVRRD